MLGEAGTTRVVPSALCASALSPLALLYGPALFNPRCFALQLQAQDALAWLAWLGGREKGGGWLRYHEANLAKKKDVAAHARQQVESGAGPL